jgi:hypothetical protein
MPTKMGDSSPPTKNASENNKSSLNTTLAKSSSSNAAPYISGSNSNVIDTDYNVRLETLNRGNPMGMLENKANCFESVYDVACNLTHTNIQDILSHKVTNSHPGVAERLSFVLNRASTHKCKYLLTERHRLEMVLVMRGSKNNKAAVTNKANTKGGVEFWPTHSLFGQEGCMVLQKKAFLILPAPLLSSCSEHHENPLVQEIDECDIGYYKLYMRQCPVLVVHELAFGPAQKNNVLPVSYWFGLAEGPDLIKAAYPQARRIVDEIKNRNKAGVHDNDADAPDSSFKSSGAGEHCLPRSLPLLFTTATPFFELRPRDESAFDLITDMMNHRRAMLIPVWRNIQGRGASESGGHLMHRLQSHERNMALQKGKLRVEFNAHKRHWNAWWSWPRTEGHALSLPLDNAAMEGPVPSGKCMYEVPRGATCNHNKHTKLRWDAFVGELNDKYSKQANKVCGASTKKVRLGKARLQVFQSLTAEEGEVGASHYVVPVLSSKIFGPIGPFGMECVDSQVKN